MGREVIQYVSPERIECAPQMREQFSEKELIALAVSIRESGLQHVPRVQRDGDHFVVVTGGRRVRAMKLLKLPEIPVIVEERSLSEAEVLQRQIVENVQRVDLLPTERAKGLKRIIELTGWQVKEAGAKCGLSASTASKLLALLNLPVELQRRMDAGEVPWSSGYELARIDDAEKQSTLARQVAEGSLSRDALSETIRQEVNGHAKCATTKSSRIALTTTNGHSVIVNGADLTVEQVIAAVEEFLAKARKALRRGLDAKGLAQLLRNASTTSTPRVASW